MHQIREVLRLHLGQGLSQRQVARSLGVSRSVVGDIVQRAEVHRLSWPLSMEMGDDALDKLLFPGPRQGRPRTADPDFAWVHRELAEDKDVTLQLLWQTYKVDHVEDGLQYSQFCDRYRAWRKTISVVLRQPHHPGEKVFVDYGGRKVRIISPVTGEVSYASLFVGVLGASSYIYAELTEGEDQRSFIMSHVRMFQFFGGVPRLIVPDNLKAAVKRPSRYEPELARGYAEMAAYYNCAVLPTRVRKPRDKAKAEVSVQLTQRWLLAALRHWVFFSLAEANQAIAELLDRLNQRPFRKMDGSRLSRFTSIDQPALGPLPAHSYEYAFYTTARVGFDCHVTYEANFYSAPHALVHQEVDLRVTDKLVEVLFHGQRVGSHVRVFGKGHYQTDVRHLPEAHRRHLEWTPERLIRWGKETGPMLGRLIEEILRERPHPEQGYRSCLGIMRLGKTFPAERLEAAAKRALVIGAKSYRSIKSILDSGLDQQPLPSETDSILPDHPNTRGGAYYAKGEEQSCSYN